MVVAMRSKIPYPPSFNVGRCVTGFHKMYPEYENILHSGVDIAMVSF